MISKKTFKILPTLIACGFAFAIGYHFLLKEDFLGGYLMMVVAWSSYFTAHYIENDCFVDGMSSKKIKLEFLNIPLLNLAGVSVILGGLFIFVLGIHVGGVLLSGAGSSLAVLAYSYLHYISHGKLL